MPNKTSALNFEGVFTRNNDVLLYFPFWVSHITTYKLGGVVVRVLASNLEAAGYLFVRKLVVTCRCPVVYMQYGLVSSTCKTTRRNIGC